MTIRIDFLGNTPEIGNIIVFNPPRYKGLVKGFCIGFQESGLPQVSEIEGGDYWLKSQIKTYGYYVPKTGFICVKK